MSTPTSSSRRTTITTTMLLSIATSLSFVMSAMPSATATLSPHAPAQTQQANYASEEDDLPPNFKRWRRTQTQSRTADTGNNATDLLADCTLSQLLNYGAAAATNSGSTNSSNCIPSNDFNNDAGLEVDLLPFWLEIGPVQINNNNSAAAASLSILRSTLEAYLNATLLLSQLNEGFDDGTKFGYVQLDDVEFVGLVGVDLDEKNDMATNAERRQSTEQQQSITVSITGGTAFYLFGPGGIFFSSVPSRNQLLERVIALIEMGVDDDDGNATTNGGDGVVANEVGGTGEQLASIFQTMLYQNEGIDLFRTVQYVKVVERGDDVTTTTTTTTATSSTMVVSTGSSSAAEENAPVAAPMETQDVESPTDLSIANGGSGNNNGNAASPTNTATGGNNPPTTYPTTTKDVNKVLLGAEATSNNNQKDNKTIILASSITGLSLLLIGAALLVKRRHSTRFSKGPHDKKQDVSSEVMSDLYGDHDTSQDGDDLESQFGGLSRYDSLNRQYVVPRSSSGGRGVSEIGAIVAKSSRRGEAKKPRGAANDEDVNGAESWSLPVSCNDASPPLHSSSAAAVPTTTASPSTPTNNSGRPPRHNGATYSPRDSYLMDESVKDEEVGGANNVNHDDFDIAIHVTANNMGTTSSSDHEHRLGSNGVDVDEDTASSASSGLPFNIDPSYVISYHDNKTGEETKQSSCTELPKLDDEDEVFGHSILNNINQAAQRERSLTASDVNELKSNTSMEYSASDGVPHEDYVQNNLVTKLEAMRNVLQRYTSNVVSPSSLPQRQSTSSMSAPNLALHHPTGDDVNITVVSNESYHRNTNINDNTFPDLNRTDSWNEVLSEVPMINGLHNGWNSCIAACDPTTSLKEFLKENAWNDDNGDSDEYKNAMQSRPWNEKGGSVDNELNVSRELFGDKERGGVPRTISPTYSNQQSLLSDFDTNDWDFGDAEADANLLSEEDAFRVE
mmetsp:Transcript_18483/g.39990  ORF Transcript_18483/g.39990 Transcript_18483/m.39990 type:complete len:961 (+) Transcript_18483:44-2926(+)